MPHSIHQVQDHRCVTDPVQQDLAQDSAVRSGMIPQGQVSVPRIPTPQSFNTSRTASANAGLLAASAAEGRPARTPRDLRWTESCDSENGHRWLNTSMYSEKEADRPWSRASRTGFTSGSSSQLGMSSSFRLLSAIALHRHYSRALTYSATEGSSSSPRPAKISANCAISS